MNDKVPPGRKPSQQIVPGCTIRTMTMWLLMALIAFTIFQIFDTGTERVDLAYSKLLDYIGQDRVGAVTILSGGSVSGEFLLPQMVDGEEYQEFTSFIPFESTGVLDSLAAHGVQITAKTSE